METTMDWNEFMVDMTFKNELNADPMASSEYFWTEMCVSIKNHWLLTNWKMKILLIIPNL